MSKKKRKHGARTKKITSARKRKIEAQRAYTAAKKNSALSDSEKRKAERKNRREKNRPRRIKALKAVLISLGALVAAAAAACIAAIFILTQRTSVEVGEVPDLSRLDGRIGSLVCTEHDAAESVDTATLGERKAECIFFGFIRRNMKIDVIDTTAPEITAADVTIGAGGEVFPEDFIVSVSDRTETVTAFTLGAPDTAAEGEQTVRLTATDEGGNTAEAEASLTVIPAEEPVFVEYGTDVSGAARIASETIGLEVGEELITADECGEYRITVPDSEKRRIAYVFVKDTTAPETEDLGFDLLLGDSLTVDMVIPKVTDASEFDAALSGVPAFAEAGDYTVDVILTDEWGNSSVINTPVRIHDIETDVTVEAGTPIEEVTRMFFGENADGGKLRLRESLDELIGKVGEHELNADGEYGSIPLRLTVTDTVAPELTLRNLVLFVGQKAEPAMFVTRCTDATEITLSFAEEPVTDNPASAEVTVIAEDEAGNRTEAAAMMYVLNDDQPPVIYGITTLYVNMGETAVYGSGVYAVDNADGNVDVKIDASQVNTSAAGTYYVRYSAGDKAGNVASALGTVVVNSISQATIDALADDVLAYITTPGMSQREKAWAIYSWCTANIKYSTRTSYLMGRFIDGAYSGFKTRMGNCYIYYSVASALLTRAGIENIEVHRNSETNPHYWNLVNIDGAWYHFDTCPHYAQYPITSFLLTDAEMSDYSEHQAIGYYDFDPALYPATP